MDHERYSRLYTLFYLARRLSPDDRRGFLELVGRAESPLRDDLDRLLAFAADGLAAHDALSESRIHERRLDAERRLDDSSRGGGG